MPTIQQQYTDQFREDFIRNLRLDFFDEEEIAGILSEIDSLDRTVQQTTFALCHSLSHASSSVVPGTLQRVRRAARVLSPLDLQRWLAHAYDLLDHQGIGQFSAFISKIDEAALREFGRPRGLRLQDVTQVIETFLRGVSGEELRVAPAAVSYTDTSTVFLPAAVDSYEGRERNYLIYKYTASLHWAQIACGCLTPGAELIRPFLAEGLQDRADLSAFFLRFPDSRFALDIYTLLEAIRLQTFLGRELPGLMRRIEGVKRDILASRPAIRSLPPGNAVVEGLIRYYLSGGDETGTEDLPISPQEDISSLLISDDASASLRLVWSIHNASRRLAGDYIPVALPLLGTMRPDEVSAQVKAKGRAMKQKMEGIITRLLDMPDFKPPDRRHAGGLKAGRQVDPNREYLLLKGRPIELDRELREIIEVRGGIPGGLLVKGSDLSGSAGPITVRDLIEESEETSGPQADGGVLYDEWDFKRGGYRKRWCTLYEKPVHPGHDPFVEKTRTGYSGYINMLRKKFELLKREPRALRRQREGDDIDLDAAIEAFADRRAGISPGEDLFTRYDRQERDIAVLFLLDMSGSTKGWISEAEKKSLVLMAEALESLGDRYAIYGFSGMTRNRCDYYRIKGFGEQYAEAVHRRISGIGPKDYTRMGAPIRHSIKLLAEVEAKTRLLVTLSDGRPEDYDAYKGNYAVEDTRKALFEARQRGIHPFCITIDREARDYLRHMYGEANYIIIDDVRQLPGRITEIYRRLTV